MSQEPEIHYSPLCQALERDGKSVEIQIYSSDGKAWVLEAIDPGGTSTVWEDTFPSDQAAWQEILDTVEQEGIECLLGINLDDYL